MLEKIIGLKKIIHSVYSVQYYRQNRDIPKLDSRLLIRNIGTARTHVFHLGQITVTSGKWIRMRLGSRGSSAHLALLACVPMKKSGSVGERCPGHPSSQPTFAKGSSGCRCRPEQPARGVRGVENFIVPGTSSKVSDAVPMGKQKCRSKKCRSKKC